MPPRLFSRHLIIPPPSLRAHLNIRLMSTKTSSDAQKVYFGNFDVTTQVFHHTPLSYALVNLKPLLPGHVLICPHRVVPRLTDLTSPEVTDLFHTVQKVQRMLAATYFSPSTSTSTSLSPNSQSPPPPSTATPEDGSFNIAIQDGADAGQSVPHVHCHVIPRVRGQDGEGDGIYDRLAGEEGNVGGHLWDKQTGKGGDGGRPVGGGQFPLIEDKDRKPRSMEEMAREARIYKSQMVKLGLAS